MKLLHSKSTAEPVLAVSACPCANLFGLVTRSAVTVYRSTTLTTVFTLSLLPYAPSGKTPHQPQAGSFVEQSEHYHCCWSLSGRLFTLALPSGLILIFDVEGGSLARVFTPSSKKLTAPCGTSFASSEAPQGAPASPMSPGSPSSPSASSTFPATVPWVATSLPLDSPVLSMVWCGVPSLVSARLSRMAAEVSSQCLPVRLGVTSALFDEATHKSAVGSADDVCCEDSLTWRGEEGSGEEASSPSSTSVSQLLVLGCDGVLRCLVGGLYEMYAAPLTLPPSLVQRGLSWKDMRVDEMQLQQYAVPLRGTSGGGDATAADGCRRRGSRSTCAALVAFGDDLMDPVLPATEQHHRLYLTVRSTAGGRLPSQELWESCLRDRLTSLAVPCFLATCYVGDYLRVGQEVYEAAQQGWRRVLQDRVLSSLGLPAAAPLLASAIMAQLTDPDPIALYRYARQTLMRAALLEDLEAMAKMLRVITYEITHVCYRCCEAAMAYAVYTTGGKDEVDDDDRSVRDVDLVAHVGALRRHYETFLRMAAADGECARDLAAWVMQQSLHWESGTYFVMNGGYTNDSDANTAASAGGTQAEEDQRGAAPSSPLAGRAGSPSPLPQPAPPQPPVMIDEVPVSATRQPALFRFLLERMSETRVGDERCDAVTSLYEQLRSCTRRMRVRFGQTPASPLRCSIVRAENASAPSSGPSTQTQLLSCVVGDGDGGKSTSSAPSSAPDSDGDEAEEAGGYRHSHTADADLDDASAYSGEYRCPAAGVPRIASQSATIYTLQSLVGESGGGSDGALWPLQLSSAALLLHHSPYDDADAVDEESAALVNTVRTAPCTVASLNAANVDVAFLRSHLKADITKEGSVAFTSSWYGLLEDDRHVVVFQPTAVLAGAAEGGANAARLATAAAPFFVAVVQDDGAVVVVDARDEEDEGEDENDDAEGGSPTAQDGADAAARVALCQVAGMEGVPLRVSVSRSRSFCVIVSVAKYVVVSLYDDDY